jgi:hypothetical protein
MRSRNRIARAVDWLIAGCIEGPMIDQEALDALINAVAAVEPEGNTVDRARNAGAESPPSTQ